MAGIGDQLKSAGKNVSKLAQEATGAVSEWWDEVNAINARRAEVRDLAREREKTLVDMGTKVYTLHRHGKVQNKDLLGDCERIDEIGERIDRLEHEIAELKRKSDEAGPSEVEISDESPVVADEDVDVSAAEAPAEAEEIEPEVEKEEAVPCAHAQDAAEGPAEDDEAGAPAECEDENEVAAEPAPEPEPKPETESEGAMPEAHSEAPVEGEEPPSMEPTPEPEGEPETDVEGSMREAHAEDPTEGSADEAGVADTAKTEVESVEPQFGPAPEGDASEPEVESEESGRCAHADAAAEGPADEDKPDARPGCEN
ncbi:MAG: hypothetical protein ACLFU7_14140 [Armatimonadota bacterium]